jgi:sugar/nucleoside kinase (ribokinase family)
VGLVGVVGGLSVDHIVQAHGEAHFDCLGGPGLYASLGASLVDGANVRLACWLPEDPTTFGHLLDEASVDLSHCASSGAPAGNCASSTPHVPRLWILYSPDGRRIVPTAAGSVEIAGADELDEDDFEAGPDFFDGLDALLACAPRHRVRHVSVRTACGIDPEQREVRRRGWSYWREVAAGTDLLLPSRMQLLLLDDDPIRAAESLHKSLGVAIVARLDRDGALVIEADGSRWRIHDSRVRVVDPTGAGDTMAGATMAGRAIGYGVAESAALGVSAARLVLSGPGAAGLVAHPEPISTPLPGVEIVKD